MIEKAKISFVVPQALQKELKEQIIKDGYGMRGKSQWISEAIEQLLALPNFVELVNYNDMMRGFEKTETAVITKSVKQKLDQTWLEIRKQYPLLEGVQSRIIRTAIVQRLLSS